jgi:hypothetical protein
VLLAPPDADPTLVNTLETALEAPINDAGMHWQVQQSLSPDDFTQAQVRLVIALPPSSGLADLAATAPQTQFLAVGIPGLVPQTNLSLIEPTGVQPDYHGFMAGAIAALLTKDWRVGIISLSDSPGGIAARQAFINGAIYHCGLCRPAYPPFYIYPVYVELPASATAAEWQAAADTLIANQVETAYVFPGAGDETLLSYLAQAGINLIGSQPPPAGIEEHWIATLSTDPVPQIQALLPELLNGQGGKVLPMPLQISNANPDLFSTGRQNYAQIILDELLAGYIDTGVTP